MCVPKKIGLKKWKMSAMAEVTNLKQRIQIKIFLDKGIFSDVEFHYL